MSSETGAEIQPIIIKRKKIVKGDGHHGGAWKVAYADFVTAMMAFFLLMWLLNATTEQQRKGIADYFSPTIPISRISGGGSDGLNGSSLFTEETYAQKGIGASHEETVAGTRAGDDDTEGPSDPPNEQQIADNLENLKEGLQDGPQKLSEHLLVKLSPEGVVLEIVDSESAPLFTVGSSTPTPLLSNLLNEISSSFGAFENDVKLVGHTDNRQFRRQEYDNWRLSSDRANAARMLLIQNGLPENRIKEVSGKADTDLLVPEDPAAAQNRRISVVILTQ